MEEKIKRRLSGDSNQEQSESNKKRRLSSESNQEQSESNKFVPITHFALSDPGKKHYQQDQYVMETYLNKYSTVLKESKRRYSFYGVYDGHAGDFCSRYLQQNLHFFVVEELARITNEDPNKLEGSKIDPRVIQKLLIGAFKNADKALCKECESRRMADGSCAITCFVLDDQCYIGNAGDSKAVLARTKCIDGKIVTRAIPLSKDHTPLLKNERKRIEKAGGFVDADGRVNGRLAVSRSFGDIKVKKFGVTAHPEFTKFTITPNDNFVLLACDGLWSVFTVKDATDFIVKQLKQEWELIEEPEIKRMGSKNIKETPRQLVSRRVCQSLVQEAVRVRGCKDNCTVVVLLFHDGLSTSERIEKKKKI